MATDDIVVNSTYFSSTGLPPQIRADNILSPPTQVSQSFTLVNVDFSMSRWRSDCVGARRVRALAWDEHRNRLAVAVVEGGAELVLLYDMDAERWDGTVLRHAWQAGVACMAPQPRACATLAVGCSTGICYWQLEPAGGAPPPPSLSTGGSAPAAPAPPPDKAWMQFWALDGFSVVACMSWSPCGR